MNRRTFLSSAAAATCSLIGSSAALCSAAERELGLGSMESNLRDHILKPWFPKSIDKVHGGFHQTYTQDWTPIPDSSRAVVYQSRLTWVAAQALTRFPAEAKVWRQTMQHGVDYLLGPMHDKELGGWYWEVTELGKPEAGRKAEKHLYGNSFAIYALAAAYQAGDDRKTLDAALEGFRWLEKHAHDAKNGGYFEAYTRDGEHIMEASNQGASDPIGTQYGLKSMNSHIHMLEALTELHHVAPKEPLLQDRLAELLHIVRDKVAQKTGWLALYFKPDWTPVPNHDSFGHDIETAFLLVEAAQELGMHDHKPTWQVARRLVDHAIEFGWDTANGGFYDAGEPDGKVINKAKVWWTQAEGLNSLKLMNTKHGKETAKYRDAYEKQWIFIKNHIVDQKYGGWRTDVGEDGAVRPGQMKSDGWKDPYHQGRAMFRLTRAHEA